MANFSFNSKKIEFLVSVSKNAGRAIMDIYKTDFDIEIKDDNSVMKAQVVRLNILTKDIEINSQDKIKIITN